MIVPWVYLFWRWAKKGDVRPGSTKHVFLGRQAACFKQPIIEGSVCRLSPPVLAFQDTPLIHLPRYHPKPSKISSQYHPKIHHDNPKISSHYPKPPRGCFQKWWYPKMDGENNGKPYFQMDDLGGKPPYFWFNTQELPAPQPSNTHAGTSNGFTFAAAPLEVISTPVMPTLTVLGTQQKRRTARYFFIKFGVTG